MLQTRWITRRRFTTMGCFSIKPHGWTVQKVSPNGEKNIPFIKDNAG
jgi:hypothetical protein